MTNTEFQDSDPIKKLDFAEDVAITLYDQVKELKSSISQSQEILKEVYGLLLSYEITTSMNEMGFNEDRNNDDVIEIRQRIYKILKKSALQSPPIQE